jgi:hypothetical protein
MNRAVGSSAPVNDIAFVLYPQDPVHHREAKLDSGRNYIGLFQRLILGAFGAMTNHIDRRSAIKSVVIISAGVATTLILPNKWIRPLVEAVVVPANAAGLTKTTSSAESSAERQETSSAAIKEREELTASTH